MLYVAVGVGLARLGVFPERVVQFVLTNFVVRFLLPLLVVQKVTGGLGTGDASSVTLAFVGAPVIVFLGTALARLLARRAPDRGSYLLAGSFHNYGFIVYPIVAALYGDRALSLAFVFALTCDGLFWSFGVHLLRSSGRRDGGGAADTARLTTAWRAMVNPPFIAVVASAVLALTGIAQSLGLPERTAPLEHITRYAIPTALVTVGGIFFHSVRSIRGALTEWSALPWGDWGRLLLVRTALIPLVVGGAAVWLLEPSAFRTVLIVQAVMPASIGMVVLPTLYGGDRVLIAGFSAVSNAMAFVTIPLYLRLFS